MYVYVNWVVSIRRLLFLIQTGSTLPILEMCKIQFWQFGDCGGHIFPRIVFVAENCFAGSLRKVPRNAFKPAKFSSTLGIEKRRYRSFGASSLDQRLCPWTLPGLCPHTLVINSRSALVIPSP